MSTPFTVRINHVFDADDWVVDGNNMEVTSPNAGTTMILIDNNDDVWDIDGNPNRSWDTLPGGFTLVGTIDWSLTVQIVFGAGANARMFDPDNNEKVALSSGTFGLNDISLSLLAIHSGFWRVRATVGAAASVAVAVLPIASTGFLISGEYDIISYTFTIDPLSGEEVVSNQIITITSDGSAGAIDLSQVSITLDGDVMTPQEQTPTSFVFSIPPGLSGPSVLICIGNGVQFAGSVTLGTYDVLQTDASGIYVVTSGKTNDTLYDRNDPGETIDVAIPDPTFKTGFIGG